MAVTNVLNRSIATLPNRGIGCQNADIPFRHEIKVNGNLPLWYGFEASASFQSYAGAQKATTGGLSWTITPGSTTYPVDCTTCPAGQVVLPRRTFHLRTISIQPQLQLFNALNGSAILGEGTSLTTRLNPLLPSGLTSPNFTYLSNDPEKGGTPSSVLQPRLIQLSVQIKF